MAMILSPSRSAVSGEAESRRHPGPPRSEQPSGSRAGRRDLPPPVNRLELRLDDLEVVLDGCQVEQLVDRDVLLDGAEGHPGRTDDLVDAECRKRSSFFVC